MPCDQGVRAAVRVSTVQGSLFIHSAFPPEDESVFLGPDSYRFAEFLRRELEGASDVRRIHDVGAGAGVGGIVAGRLTGAGHVTLSDVNPVALRYAQANAAHAGVGAITTLASGLEGAADHLDLVVANPPFIADGRRLYSDGGDMMGMRLSLDWAIAAMSHLQPGGRLLMYTGSPIVDGRDPFHAALREHADAAGWSLEYRELDPDIFAGQLSRRVYTSAERIAAIGVSLRLPG